MLNVKQIKDDFPIFKNHPNLIYFDTSSTALKPQSVIDSIVEYYSEYGTNVYSIDSILGRKTYEKVKQVKKIISEFINGKPEEIIFTPSCTYGLNYLAQGLAKKIQSDDEIILTHLEHSSNVLPWMKLANEKQVKIKYLPLKDYLIDVKKIEEVLSSKTKIVSFANSTNTLGGDNDVKAISDVIKKYNKDIIIIVDAAQSMAHIKTDVKDWNIDFLVCSGHKMFSALGISFLWGKFNLLEELEPLMLGGGVVYKFKDNNSFELISKITGFVAGSPNVSGIFSFEPAIKYLQKIGLENISEHGWELKKYAIKRIREEKLDITIYNENTKCGVLLFNVNNVAGHDVTNYLSNKYNIVIRTGQHCAKLINNTLNVQSTLRASFFIYNSKEEIDILIEALKKAGDFTSGIF